MDFRTTSNSVLLSLCVVFTFFLGFAAFTSHVYIPFIALVSVFTITVIFSYFSQNPLGGIIIGVLFIGTFFMGYLCFECIQVSMNPDLGSSTYIPRQELERIYLNGSDPWGRALRDSAGKWTYFFLTNTLSFSEHGRLPSMISTTIAFSSIGFFFGLIGYILQRFIPSTPETHPFIFRDYWSQINNWAKSDKPEYPFMDRNLHTWKIGTFLRGGQLLNRIQRKSTYPDPELLFIPITNLNSTKKNGEGKGNLYLQSSEESLGEFRDYNELINKYKPKLHFSKKTSIGNNDKEIKDPSKEGIVTSLVDKALESRDIIVIYFLLAFAFPLIISIYAGYYGLFGEFSIISIIGVILPSIITFILARKFRQWAKELVKKRPDERVLVFYVFICFFLIFGTIYMLSTLILVFEWPTYLNFDLYQEPFAETWLLIPPSWATEFLLWAAPFVLMSAILGLGYIFIHRETENINVYFFDNRPEKDVTEKDVTEKEVNIKLKPFKKIDEKPNWLVGDNTPFFWVIRFMYYWRFEVTIPFPHSDWERVELWINAKNGDLKWIVSDYHYRELCYKVKESKPDDLHVNIFTNFHTPAPVTNPTEKAKVRDNREEIKPEYFENIVPIKKLQVVKEKFEDLHWFKWRYRYGVNYTKEKSVSKKWGAKIKNFVLGKDLEKEKLEYETKNSND